MKRSAEPLLFDHNGRPLRLSQAMRKAGPHARQQLSRGFKGANDENLVDWAFLPLEINQILRNDLQKLRARSRDLARNDDTARRFLHILKQNVLGHAGIILQAKNKLSSGKPDAKWNSEIEREWQLFMARRRFGGVSISPSACGQMSGREIAWLSLLTRAIDGECFIQILRGYKHNPHLFAVRFLNPDLLDSAYTVKLNGGNRIDMGIELDEFDRPINYHFSTQNSGQKFAGKDAKRIPIPASQIIHLFRREYVGQIRGIPDFAGVMHKAKMLNGVDEAVVVGWRVAAAKMGFFTVKDPDDIDNDDFTDTDDLGGAFDPSEIEATPGTFEKIPAGYDLKLFDPEYPTSTYEAGHRVFMQQLANGLNVSSPTLSNDYSQVNYSSLRQALLEDREGWRCIQAEMIDGFYQQLFDDWYEWAVTITGRIALPAKKRVQDPAIVWQPRGWPWVDPLKEVKAQVEAINNKLRTRQSIIAETSGADFIETVDALAEEERAIVDRGMSVFVDQPRQAAPAAAEREEEQEVDE